MSEYEDLLTSSGLPINLVQSNPLIHSLMTERGLKWILDNQNSDGGWGRKEPDEAGKSMSWRTSLVVWVLGEYNLKDEIYENGLKWLITNQNPDGGWGAFKGEKSYTWLTSFAIKALITSDPGISKKANECSPKLKHWGIHSV